MTRLEAFVRDYLNVYDRELTALDHWKVWRQATPEQRELLIEYESELPYLSFAERVCANGPFEL
jgi:hypothetical protein